MHACDRHLGDEQLRDLGCYVHPLSELDEQVTFQESSE